MDKTFSIEDYNNVFKKAHSSLENNDKDRIEENFELMEKHTLNLFWEIHHSKNNHLLSDERYEAIIKAKELLALCQQQIERDRVINPVNEHTYDYSKIRGGARMKKLASVFPFIAVSDISKATSDFAAMPSIKLAFVLLGALLGLLFGELGTFGWVFVVLTVAHFISRIWANSNSDQNDYIKFSKSIQLFILPYFWLAIGNALSQVVSIDGLPEGSFYAILIMLLIWGELKGIVVNMKAANLPVPAVLEKLVRTNKDEDTPL
jgi:phage-related holin